MYGPTLPRSLTFLSLPHASSLPCSLAVNTWKQGYAPAPAGSRSPSPCGPWGSSGWHRGDPSASAAAPSGSAAALRVPSVGSSGCTSAHPGTLVSPVCGEHKYSFLTGLEVSRAFCSALSQPLCLEGKSNTQCTKQDQFNSFSQELLCQGING